PSIRRSPSVSSTSSTVSKSAGRGGRDTRGIVNRGGSAAWVQPSVATKMLIMRHANTIRLTPLTPSSGIRRLPRLSQIGRESRLPFLALTVTAMLAVANAAGAQPRGADARAWFQRTEQALMDAIAAGDRRPWEAVMDDRCLMTTEEGEVLTKDKFLK